MAPRVRVHVYQRIPRGQERSETTTRWVSAVPRRQVANRREVDERLTQHVDARVFHPTPRGKGRESSGYA